MPSMFQQAFRMAQQFPGRDAGAAAPRAEDDDIALGWECANPALQFERWEPELAPLPLRVPLLSSKS